MPGGLYPPYSVIEAWPAPNYVNFQENGNWVFIFCVILTAVALAVVSVRMYARRFVLHNFGLDDWIMLVAIIPALAFTINTCIGFKYYHFNRHVWDIPITSIAALRKIQYSDDIFYIFASGLIKISILLFYRRLNPSLVTRMYQYMVWTGISIMLLQILLGTFLLPLTCRPTSAYWNQFDPIWASENQFKCLNEAKGILIFTAIGTITDFMSTILPLRIFWGLQIPIPQKIASFVILGFGFFVSAIGCARIYYIVQIYFFTYDASWVGTYLFMWTIVEMMVGAICASLPALKVFFRSTLGGDSAHNMKRPNGMFRMGTNDYPMSSGKSNCSDLDITAKGADTPASLTDEEKELSAYDIKSSSRRQSSPR